MHVAGQPRTGAVAVTSPLRQTQAWRTREALDRHWANGLQSPSQDGRAVACSK